MLAETMEGILNMKKVEKYFDWSELSFDIARSRNRSCNSIR